MSISVVQYEIGNDSQGASRLAAEIQQAGSPPAATIPNAVAVYDREAGAAFLVAVNGFTAGSPTAAHVEAIQSEIEGEGIAAFEAALQTAFTAGKVYLISFTVFKRNSGSAFATAIVSD